MNEFSLTPAFKLTVLLLSISLMAIYFCSRINTESEAPITPCSPKGFPGRCYNVQQEMCEIVWDDTEETCKKFVEELHLPPGRLVGPVVLKCRLMYFDKPFTYGRKSTPECDEVFRSLELWKKRNNF